MDERDPDTPNSVVASTPPPELALEERLVSRLSAMDTTPGPLATSPDPSSPDPISLPPGADGARYSTLREIGRGGMGVVIAVEDSRLGRTVAVKTHRARDSRAMRRFIEEARATAQLEHPSIVPVYDISRAEDGSPFFTMRMVEGLSLREILARCRADDVDTLARFDTTELLLAFLKICDAVAYAHSRRVLHRDLKPDNIMLGRFGEVFVMDWGLARIGGAPRESSTPSPEREVTASVPEGNNLTIEGAIVGTPGYMAPEQARGAHDVVDERADVFALGTILYEILSLLPAFTGATSTDLLLMTLTSTVMPPSRRAPARNVPAVYDEIVLAALARDLDERTASVTSLREQVAHALEGSREASKRRARALERLEEAADHRREHERLSREHAAAIDSLAERRRTVLVDDAPARRRIWMAESSAAVLAMRAQAAFWNGYGALAGALADDPGNVLVRRALVDVLLDRAETLREAGERGASSDLEAISRQHDPVLTAARLDAPARVRLDGGPAGAAIRVARFEAEGPLSVERPSLDAMGPIEVELAPGSYIADFERANHHHVRLPFVVRPGQHVEHIVSLPPERAVAKGFVVIPRGIWALGGDTLAPSFEPRREVDLPAFAIARNVVTMAEYGEWLNELALQDSELARSHAPRIISEPFWKPERDGAYRTPFVDLEGDTIVGDAPVFGINALDADDYASWRAERSGFAMRLPTSDEWEVAARGSDERPFPWGWGWDPSLCWNLISHGSAREMHGVGTRPLDRSVFGLYDVAGLVRQWTLAADADGRRRIRGGAWQASSEQCRLGRVSIVGDRNAYATFSMRLAHDLRS